MVLGEYLKVSVHICTDNKILKRGEQIIVGTPSMVYDMISKGFLQSTHLKLLVLDETDQMLAYNFKEQIRQILLHLSRNIQIGLFSVTIPSDVLDITKQFMNQPAIIQVKNDELTLDGIKQFYIDIEKDEWKFDTLKEIYSNLNIVQVIIYTNSSERVDLLTQQLKQDGIVVSSFHGEMKQDEKDLNMKEFRCGASQILVTTDALPRDIDIQLVSLVINYDLPQISDKKSYIQRIGRSGRFGRKGMAINFVVPADGKFINEAEKFYNTKIDEMPLDISKLMEE